MDISDDAVVTQILKAIGKRVSFEYPGNEGSKTGTLKDRAVLASSASSVVPYWDVVDLIEFHGEPEPEWLRIGYYRKPADRLVWGSKQRLPSLSPYGDSCSFMRHARNRGSESYLKKSSKP